MTFTAVCRYADLAEGIATDVNVDGVPVCLVRLGSDVFAIHDECTHEAVPLSEGDVEDGAVECWRHGSRFDLRTGAVLSPPAVKPVPVYATVVQDGQVQVDVAHEHAQQ